MCALFTYCHNKHLYKNLFLIFYLLFAFLRSDKKRKKKKTSFFFLVVIELCFEN